MGYKVDENPQRDTCHWSMYSNILKGPHDIVCTHNCLSVTHNCLSVVNTDVSVNSSRVHLPGKPPGISSKNCPGGQDLGFESCPGGGNSTSVINIGCPKKLLKMGNTAFSDFQFKLC